MQNVDMKEADNDNFEFSFITLSAATKNVTRYLCDPDKQKDGEGHDDANRRDSEEKKSSNHSAYVEQRLRDLAAFERRAGGKKN